MTEKLSNLEYLRRVVKTAAEAPFNTSGRGAMRAVPVELAKMELLMRGEPCVKPSLENLDGALEYIARRNDCADFIIPVLVRLLYEHEGSDRLSAEYAEKIKKTLTGFKYWLDEPGEVHACFFTENHQILYHSDEYLVGQRYPDAVFDNGQTGEWHRLHAIPFIRRWLDWRNRFGFSEWLCQGYYAEDMLALIGLTKYAAEEDIRLKAKMTVDQLLFDMAVNSFQGHLSGTHGRAYTNSLINPDTESVTSVMALMWGEGTINYLSDITTLLASYDYKCPDAIVKAALDKPAVMENRERMSINVADAKYYGADPADFDNIMLFWGIQAYSDRLTIENSMKVFPYYNWMNNRIFAYKERYDLCDEAGVPAPAGTPDYTAMTQVDIYTYKTPDYMLSCSQDFRSGLMGYQQHPWTAYLGGHCTVFTNNPGSENMSARPNKLAGNLVLPRAVAYKNVQLSAFRVLPDFVDFLYTQCYFPQDEFNEVVEKDGWLFGRRENAYIAVRSLNEARWEEPSPDYFRMKYGEDWVSVWSANRDPDNGTAPDGKGKPYIYMTPGHANVWVTELGSKAENGRFEDFMAGFKNAAVTGDTHRFTYNSPSQGEMKFGWVCGLTVEGRDVGFHDYPRYDNPYCQAEFNAGRLEINAGGSRTILDGNTLEFLDK